MPGAEWMYRLLYQRGQLSVGERMYQATMPGYDVPYAEPWTNGVGLASVPKKVELRLTMTLAYHVLPSEPPVFVRSALHLIDL